ncbi:LacI family transcriptional regulator [Streptomyces ruber]|uniref:LacI family transcriptional regulator n=2 Tax=Streptomyces TaxID=1883 RepID=A0A918BB20_9ACTN|nr:LacI family DNA-binding transcriptional regulator [Streptomyces ruber]GGQ53648.1 LacI family transcriptional regulator [Streptomyces ruber]
MVKITDVARHAGVAPSTVSYALSGKRPISAATRRRVEESIRALGYRPPLGLGGAGRRGSNVLALVTPLRAGVPAPAAMEYALAAVTAARGHDHDVLLVVREEGEEALRQVVESTPADALIVTGGQARDARAPLLSLLRRHGRPSVLVGSPADPTGLTCVDLDHGAAGELCVEHLVGLGHRVVALVGAPPEAYLRGTGAAQRMVRGFTATADRHGLSSAVRPCPASPAAARAVAERLLRERPALTGVVVHNEAVVEPLIEAFEALGLRVPADLSLIAVRPPGPATTSRSPVTSVDVPAAEAGAGAVDLLMRKLNGAHVPETTLLPPRLTFRTTTGPRATP